MPTPLIVALIIGCSIVILAGRCIVGARRAGAAKRIFAAVTFAPIALFCLWGFAAAMEPGDFHIVWRVLYAVVFLACLSAIVWLMLAKPTVGEPSQD